MTTDYATLKEKLRPLESSSIKSVAYEAGGEVLSIAFGSGDAIYRYAKVPSRLYLDLLEAKSPGKFFQAEIRGKFDQTKVEPDTDSDQVIEKLAADLRASLQ